MSAKACLCLSWITLLLGFLALTFAQTPVTAQTPPKKKMREEEEEEPEKTRVPKKIDDPDPKMAPNTTPTRQPPPPTKFDIAEAAGKAKNVHVREFLRRLSIPYDLLISAGGRTYRIGLLASRKLPDSGFSYYELDAQLNKGNLKELPSGTGFSLQPFEEMVIEEVDSFLRRQIDGVLLPEKKELAVQVLQTTRRFHVSAVEQRKRVGKEWDAVDDKLKRRIIQIRREQLQAAIAAKDFRKADDISLDLSNYADDAEAMKDVYKLLLQKELEAANPDKDEDFFKIRDALHQFENIAGGKGDPMALSARRRLSERARHHVQAAKKLSESNQNAAAFSLLKAADALDPDLADIQKLRSQLRDRILYVGVPRLPSYLSPDTARLDSEHWGVDLLFESLLDVIPDVDLGRKYEPVLAAAMPSMVPLGREFVLRRNIRWSGDSSASVNAHDIFGTLELMRKFPEHPASEGLDVFDTEMARVEDPFRLRLVYRYGVLEPLNRTTFKVLPARYLKSNNKDADDDAFARKPFGSGPYRYEGREKEAGDREVAVFRANPYFNQRPGNFGQPHIHEIRMVVPKLSSAPANFSDGLLHIAFDVPTADLPRYTGDPLAGGLLKVWTPANNRRIWMLALNHRRQALQNVDLRRGISASIDREEILNAVYRTDEMRNVHKTMTGPFPLNSWATPPKAREKGATLTNRTLAGGLLTGPVAAGHVRLNLRYADDDPRALRACGKIKEQIEAAAGMNNGRPALEIELKPIEGDKFFKMLLDDHDFDMAYCSFDYKDDLFWLGGLLDRSASGRGGRNFLGYLADGSNAQLDDNEIRLTLDEIRSHRDFKDKYRELTWKVHKKFLERMPFVPLWQIDRHMVVHNGLEMYWDDPSEKVPPDRLDPAAVFTGIESWRLK
jgi:peptide/nickel transport system substrate-binding protein